MNRYWKFGVLTAVILATLAWLAVAGINESKTYYVTVQELQGQAEKALDRRLRVAGDVEAGSIVRSRDRVEFVLRQDARMQKVVYTGRDPLPDTFKDRAQAICDGRMGAGGVFEAKKIQAKCASKYEANPGADQLRQTVAPKSS